MDRQKMERIRNQMIFEMMNGDQKKTDFIIDLLDKVLDASRKEIADYKITVTMMAAFIGDMMEDQGMREKTYSPEQAAVILSRGVTVQPRRDEDGSFTICADWGQEQFDG